MRWEPIGRLRELELAIWAPRRTGLSPWKAFAVRTARLAIVLVRDVMTGTLTLRAMSLVYTTLLSMVPLLALSFSVLKAFGVHNRIEPVLQDLLAPLGAQGDQITRRLVEFIDHMNVGVLGSVGLALLIYTVVSLMEKIEESFNSIWHVTQLRSLGERYSRYLSVLLVGPILVFSAIGITAIALNSDIVQGVLAIGPLGSARTRFRQAGALRLGDWRLHVFLHICSQCARSLCARAGGRHRRRDSLAIGRLGVRPLCGLVDALCRDLFELCDTGFVHDLVVRQLVDPAFRSRHFVLCSASGVHVCDARGATAEQSHA